MRRAQLCELCKSCVILLHHSASFATSARGSRTIRCGSGVRSVELSSWCDWATTLAEPRFLASLELPVAAGKAASNPFAKRIYGPYAAS
jgi:hypothetical protein